MLLEQAPRSIDVPLTAAPPHVVTVLGPVHLARPVEVLFLGKVFLAVEAEFGVNVDYLTVFQFVQLLF
jgi:hypothetical protein